MSKHTPGPWRYEYDNYGNGGFSEWNEIVSDNGSVGRVYGNDSEARANASLIAQAPLMLKALESIENDDGHIPAPIWAMRNAAIAKATGDD